MSDHEHTMSTPSTWVAARSTRIDVLRVAAILMVFFHHADDYGRNYLRITPTTALIDDVLTWAALATLFALAGFLTFGASTSDTSTGWNYAKRRFVRLYPPFALALLLAQAVGVFPLPPKSVLVNLALLGPWVGPNVGTLWFVEVLIYFQVVFAVWLSLPRLRGRPWSIPIVAGVMTAAAAILARALGFAADARLVTYLPAFAGGAILGAALRFRNDPPRWRAALVTGGLLAAAVSVAVAAIPVWPKLIVLDVVVAVVTTMIVATILIVPARIALPRTRFRDLAHWLAYGSYMGYLVHRPVFQSIAKATAGLGAALGWVLVLAGIPLVFGLGILLQRGYDTLLERKNVPR